MPVGCRSLCGSVLRGNIRNQLGKIKMLPLNFILLFIPRATGDMGRDAFGKGGGGEKAESREGKYPTTGAEAI